MDNRQITIIYRNETLGSRTYRIKFIAEVTHKGLNDYRVLSSDDSAILQNKVNAHVVKLEEKWQKVIQRNHIFKTKEEIQRNVESRNREAQDLMQMVDSILHHTLNINDTIDWEQLKDKSRYNVPYPEDELPKLISSIRLPTKPVLSTYTAQPDAIKFQPKLTFLDGLIKSKKDAKLQEAQNLYERAINDWKRKCELIDQANHRLKQQFEDEKLKYERDVEYFKKKIAKKVNEWQIEKAAFLKQREESNYKIALLKEAYLKHDTAAVIEYCDLVLNNSTYPEDFPQNFELDYIPETKILIVEYSLPSMDQLPSISEVKVVKGEAKETYLSETQLQKIFDSTMYKITLRTLHELFEADSINAIDAITFNGWINSINKGTGLRENNCILTIQVKKEEFTLIDLRHVDPKTCFKNLKGVGSSKLSGMTAVAPILQINKNDSRFVNSYDVADSLNNTTNLAAMDWEDFEHLIREVFGKEFSSNGGEVKVTQASRDGGVDAIAFDPDPIRGGKIVIQAKRYTNTVGVSAVRDLYGTVMNEGATKGILVTTADYGPDAYEFVKGKPLTLMNGGNLLYLLEKHGHRARIDLKEAKLLSK
ncbi:restriction endonuclease [Pedobacter sp. N36a]|uniref:restriction endonuclease n=1 Tax=Pedobacter sp. N36a TaxID=2767996 RepID=UPI001657417F|nr:restriction endonuclease [Pedobacter sp. N36a]MBC8985375.1 restriction endonuclease [Pedobacter sp. N36a]